jgi:hypothetical protein
MEYNPIIKVLNDKANNLQMTAIDKMSSQLMSAKESLLTFNDRI